MKLDFKNVALSTAGGLAVVAVGYLVWRHEQALTVAQAAQANQNNTDTIAALTQQVQDLESQQQSAYSSYGQTSGDYSQVSGTTLASVPTDTNLTSILQAFLGSQNSTVGTASPSGTSDSNTATTSTPTNTTQVAQTGIPASLVSGTAVTGINQQNASNPIVTSTVGAATGQATPAVSASHTLQYPTTTQT